MTLDSLHAGHVLAGLVYFAMILILRGAWGNGAGLHDLFRDKAAHAALFNDPPAGRNPAPPGPPGHSWQLWLSPGFTTMALFTLWIGLALSLLGLPLHSVAPPKADAVPLAEGWPAFFVLSALSLVALGFGRPPPGHDPRETSATTRAFLRRLAGLGAGLVTAALLGWVILPALQTWLLLPMAASGQWWGLLTALLLFGLSLVAMVAASLLWVQAGAAWFMLLIVLTTGFALLAQLPVLLMAVLVTLLVMCLACRLTPFRYRIPGIPARYYESPITPGAATDEPEPALVPPQVALGSWHTRRQAGPGGKEKPRLVMLALSGGGYRATFWAAAVLDELLERDRRLARSGAPDAETDDTADTGDHLDGFVDSIRFIAGASGGMVTGGYLAELSARAAAGSAAGSSLVTMIEDDIEAFQKQEQPIAPPGMPAPPPRRVRIRRDSLSAIAWQLLADLGHIFRAGTIAHDRGRVLQAQWPALDTPFNALRDDEAQGRRPSAIYSPMLIESGAPFFISNLDLSEFRTHYRRNGRSDADEHSAELFRVLPGAYSEADGGLTAATAARLSATFPYVLPAISLPTRPHRRVVDAGYYDNYGIDVVTGLLNTDAVRNWVVEHCSGVLIIALRAFPDDPPSKPAARISQLFWWLTSPVEAMFNARGSSQTFRNREQLRLTRQLYGAALAAQGGFKDWQQRGRDFIDIVTFTCEERASMSWHLSEADMERLRSGAKAATTPRPRGDGGQNDMRRLLDLWNGRQGSKPPA